MHEAEHCDRMSMMHAGVVLDTGTPQELVQKRGAQDLEEAFIGYLIEAMQSGDLGTDAADEIDATETAQDEFADVAENESMNRISKRKRFSEQLFIRNSLLES